MVKKQENFQENRFTSFPIELQFQNISQSCLVIGGGKVATRKVRSLINAGAEVTIIAPDISEELLELFQQDKIKWEKRNFTFGDIEDYLLVFACTSDSSLNTKIAKEAKQRGVLVNVATSQTESSFTIPASLNRGDLTLTVSTKGASPALSAQIIRDLQKSYGPEWKKFLTFMRISREIILSRVADEDQRKQLFHELAGDEDLFNLVVNTEEEKMHSLCEQVVTEKIGG